MKKPLVIALIVSVLVVVFAGIFTVIARQPIHDGDQYMIKPQNTDEGQRPQHSIQEGTSMPSGIVAGDEVATSTSGNIMVSSPKAHATIGNSVTISGSARVFENTLNYRVLDGKGTVLAEGTTIANAPDIGQFGEFSITPTWSTPKTITGTIEVFDYSAKDGSVIDLVTIPVGFAL